MLFEATDELLAKLETLVNFEENPVTYLAIDPGESNGISFYSSKYELMAMWTVKQKDMIKFLKQFKNVKLCVVENFLLYPNKANQQRYSDMKTSLVIGRIEAWAETNDVQVVKQNANIKKNAYMWMGQKPLPKSNPMNHEMDAHAHFIYWAVRTGKISASSLLKNFSKEK